MTWPRVPIGEIFRVARGGSPRPIDAFITDDPEGVNWIMIGDATEGAKYISSSKKRIRRDGISRSRMVKPGDFLLTNSMSFGHPYILNTTGCIHDGWLVLSPQDDNVNQDYFYHLLGSPLVYEEFERLAAGAVVKNLNSELVRGVKVPFPPIAEQRRIANILDKADAIRRKRKEAIALTEDLLRSAFLEMFGDPVTNPKRWPVSTFGAEVTVLEYGPRFYNEKYAEHGVRIVRITDLESSGVLDFESMPRLIVDVGDQERYLLQPGDVIFARSGATVGKTALSVQGDPPAIPGAYFIRLRFNDRVSPRYARQVLASERVQQIIVSRSRQSAQQNFSGPGIRELPLPLPPRRLQDKLDTIAAGQARHLVKLCRASNVSDNLFNSLVTRSFSGALESSL